MRSSEFIIEHVDLNEIDDIGEYQSRFLHEELRRHNLPLYESHESVKCITDFLDQFKTFPIIGNTYIPLSVVSLPLAKLVNIAQAPHSGRLVRISSPNVFFDFGKGSTPFPYNLIAGDEFRTTIFCESLIEQEKFISWAHLTLTGWHITRKII